MTDPRASDAYDELAVGWVLHTLDRDEEVDVLVHLRGCPVCRAAVSDISATMSSLGGAVAQDDPPARVREGLMAAVAAEPEPPRNPVSREDAVSTGRHARQDEDGRESDDRESGSRAPDAVAPDDGGATVVPLRRSRARRLALVAAVAVVVAAIGGLVAVNRSVTAERDAQAAQAERVTTLLRDAGRPGAVRAMLARPDGAMVGMVVDIGSGPRVMTTGLSDNTPDHTYVLWSLGSAAPHPVGTFDVSGSSPSVRSVGSVEEAGRPAAYAVSLEPGRVAPASPTTIVASGQVGS